MRFSFDYVFTNTLYFLPTREKVWSRWRTMINAAARWSHIWMGPKRQGGCHKRQQASVNLWEIDQRRRTGQKRSTTATKSFWAMWRRTTTKDARSCDETNDLKSIIAVLSSAEQPWTSSAAAEKAMTGNNLYVCPRHFQWHGPRGELSNRGPN